MIPSITISYEQYKELLKKQEALDNGAVHVSLTHIGMGCYDYKICGLHKDSKDIIERLKEKNTALIIENSNLRDKINPVEVNKPWYKKLF